MTKELPIQWSIEKRKIKDLHIYAKNPRKCTKKTAEEIQGSLQRFGQCEPIIINTDNIIIGGHQRVQTLKKMGVKEVDVSIPERHLDEKEIEELNIKLNKISADWDIDILANVFDPIELLDWGFTPQEIGVSLFDTEEKEEKEKKKKECPNCGHSL